MEEQPAVENILKASEASAVSSATSPLAGIAGQFHLFLFHKTPPIATALGGHREDSWSREEKKRKRRGGDERR